MYSIIILIMYFMINYFGHNHFLKIKRIKKICLIFLYCDYGHNRVIGISGSLIWPKYLMELIFNHCGEFRWSAEGPVSQIHSTHLHAGSPGIFSDLLISVQMLKREWCAESKGNRQHIFITSKTATFGPWVCGGRTVFGQNCSLGSWVCSEKPALDNDGHNYLFIMKFIQ